MGHSLGLLSASVLVLVCCGQQALATATAVPLKDPKTPTGPFVPVSNPTPVTDKLPASRAIQTVSIGYPASPTDGNWLKAPVDVNNPITFLSGRYNKNVVFSLSWRLANGKEYTTLNAQNGGPSCREFTDEAYTDITLTKDSVLSGLELYDSGFGYRSVRKLVIKTLQPTTQTFSVGPEGFDNVQKPQVAGGQLLGFAYKLNSDCFLQSLAVIISSPIAKVSATNFVFNAAAGVVQPLDMDVTLAAFEFPNYGPNPLSTTTTQDFEYTQTSSIASTWGLTASMEVGLEVGVKDLITANAKITTSASYTSQTSGAITSTVKNSFGVNPVVSAHSIGHLKAQAVKYKQSVPYTASVTLTYSNGTTTTIPTFRGVAENTSMINVRASYSEDPLASPSPAIKG
ncbi:hypothetical protein WJX72_003090 [[Myrmecia] bisecta]|uniref:Uncharacterized protein n=1 Tax=[Myrmecia] bisecta TaxID=41462 RepID=A0AAW1Q0U3_9CHLO